MGYLKIVKVSSNTQLRKGLQRIHVHVRTTLDSISDEHSRLVKILLARVLCQPERIDLRGCWRYSRNLSRLAPRGVDDSSALRHDASFFEDGGVSVCGSRSVSCGFDAITTDVEESKGGGGKVTQL